LGLAPAIVLGHSMGEVAAAEAAGILDLESAVRVIYFRSLHQEVVRGAGGMAAVFGPLEVVDRLVGRAPGRGWQGHSGSLGCPARKLWVAQWPRAGALHGRRAARDAPWGAGFCRDRAWPGAARRS